MNRFAASIAMAAIAACTSAPPPEPPPHFPVASSPPASKPLTSTRKVMPKAVDGAPPPWVMGLALPFGPTIGVKDAAKAEEYFSIVLGHPVEARLYDYDTLANAVTSGSVDFAFMPPLAYVKAVQKMKLALLRQAMHNGSLLYRSVLFVRADSPIKTVEQLKGHSVAWVSGGSTSGHLVPLAWLESRHLDPEKYFSSQTSFGDHGKVCDAVESGKAEIGASFSNNKGEAAPIVDGCVPALGAKISDLRIVYSSANIPNDVFVAREGNPELLVALGEELDRMGTTDQGRAVLASGFQADAFYPVEDSVFDPIRTLFSSTETIDAGTGAAKTP